MPSDGTMPAAESPRLGQKREIQAGKVVLEMIWPSVLNLFLYFPEDKREYIPAAISFAVFFLMAVFTMRLIIVISRKQENEAKRLERELLGKKDEPERTKDV
ncbi:hypothetical protein GsuE55_22120 [Geobacillus subterraneus]|uniref:Uncharacterized protein n=1 Tax=Geobacillus subterraneus TaxID=129338 RepID=A0A679FQQ7_9BACL|nr:hypothetical protein GsuE55_22120 [Geobacillus subterraneus]